MKSESRKTGNKKRGVALVVILAFVVLLTVLVLAFFSYSSLQRQISNANSNQATVEIFAKGALNTVLSDLRQEIAAGSTTNTYGSFSVYIPLASTNAVPVRVGTSTNLPNLIKRSATGIAFSPSGTARAAAVSSTNTSQNGRSISRARWNAPLLLPKAATNTTDPTPIAAFTAPDWILVNRGGGNPTGWNTDMRWSPTNTSTVLGRFAYAIYDEGGGLDVNVAGYPPGTSPALSGYKNALAYADLTQVGLGTNTISALVGWRNKATAQPGGSFPNFTFNGASQTNFFNAVAGNTTGFLSTANTNLINGESDRKFISRQQLIQFFNALGTSGLQTKAELQNALQYLGTFSRGLEQPAFSPHPDRPKILAVAQGGNSAFTFDNQINPSLLTIRAQGAFPRADGTTAESGEPLVKKRFPLNRLAWLTHEGPSATASSATQTALRDAGVSQENIDLGTAANIQKSFGLNWDAANQRWLYNAHNGTSGGGPTGSILRLGEVAALTSNRREPDFFELLKAGITAGSLAKSSWTQTTGTTGVVSDGTQKFQHNSDIDLDAHIVQVAANIFDQSDVDGYPVRIGFDNGSGVRDFYGTENLPYIYRVRHVYWTVRMTAPDADFGWYGGPPGGGAFVTTSGTTSDVGSTKTVRRDGSLPPALTATGVVYIMGLPDLWNPHDLNATRGASGLFPTSFRVVAQSAPPGGVPQAYFIRGNGDRIGPFLESNTNLDPALPFPVYAGSNGDATGWGQHPRKITTANSGLYFDIPNSTQGNGLFREPTVLYKAGVPSGSNLSARDPSGLGEDNAIVAPQTANDDGNLQLYAAADGVQVEDLSTGYQYNSNLEPKANGVYLGVYYGAIPLAAKVKNQPVGTNREWVTVRQAGSSVPDLTYMVQYFANGQWQTYDTKYAPYKLGNLFASTPQTGSSFPHFVSSSNEGDIPVRFHDPRTGRFGRLTTPNSWREVPPWTWPANSGAAWVPGPVSGMLDVNNAVVSSDRHDQEVGQRFGNYGGDHYATAGGFYLPGGNGWPALLTQNRSDVFYGNKRYSAQSAALPSPLQAQYYTDGDGVLRRAMAAYVKPTGSSPASSVTGLPQPPAGSISNGSETATVQSQSRPYILNRPFRSVTELGYTFKGTPWKNIDFFTPESGDSALLDIFCINETTNPDAMAAGKINLNTLQAPALKAVLAGGYVDETAALSPAPGYALAPLTPAVADSVASALSRRTTPGQTTASGTPGAPLMNLASIVGQWSGSVTLPNNTLVAAVSPNNIDGPRSFDGLSKDLDTIFDTAGTNPSVSMNNIQRLREAAIRPLINTGQTRIWNLLIDLVVQTGRYAPSASNLSNFTVEGEQRLWVHLAIDRWTGEVIDQQIETVKE